MKTFEIPDYPTITLSNYINKLSNKIWVSLESDLIAEVIQHNIKDISLDIGILESSLKRYTRKKKYPLFLIRKLDKFNRNLYSIIEDNNPLFFSRRPINLPNMITPKLAYFLGYLQGDGSIESNRKRINFTDGSLEQLERINFISYQLFKVKGKIREINTSISKKIAYTLEIGSLVLNSYLSDVFGINRGIKTNLKVPPILIANKDVLRWYLKGLFDADGTLPKNPKKAKQLFIDITLKDKEFILQIKGMLELFGINTLNPYCRIAKSPNSEFISKTWELRIRKKEDMVKFLKEVGFFHSDKLERAESLLAFLHQ